MATFDGVSYGRLVQRRTVGALKPGDLVQHYSTWEQTWGDPIHREVVEVREVPGDERGNDRTVTWFDPFDLDVESYSTREKAGAFVDVIVGTPPAVLPPLDVCEVIAAEMDELARLRKDGSQ